MRRINLLKSAVLSSMLLLLFAVVVQAQVATINTANGTTGNGPMGSSTYHISEHIFLQTEMGIPAGTAIPISFMKFNIATLLGNPTTFNNVAIYAKTTTATVFAASSTYAGTAGYTLLYSGSISFTATGLGGVNIPAGTYTYPNTAGDNLDLLIIRTNSSGNAGHVFNAALGNSASTANLTCRRYNSTAAPVVGTTALTGSAFRTCIQFGTNVNNDAAVQGLYTLGKMPIEYGAPTVIQANIKNNGLNALTNIPVTLTITGTNSFTDVQTIPALASGASAIVNFSNYYPGVLSTNDVVTATIPTDDVPSNNTATWNMQITPNVYTYKNASQANAGGVGFNGATGDFVAKFNSNPGINWPYQNAPLINEIKVDFAAGGQPYNLGIWDATGVGGTPGNLLWTSPNLTSAAGTAVIPVPDIPVSGDYFVGVKQTGTTNVSFAYQAENPIRPQTFYYTSPTGNTSWTDFSATNSAFRFAIEVSVHIPVPPNCAISLLPADNTTTLCQSPVLSWGSGGGAPTGYDVYLSTIQSDITNLNISALVSANQTGTSYTPTLSPNTTYYWTVIPKNVDGDAINCGFQTFTTGVLTNCYCTPVHSVTCSGIISDVSLNSLSNATSCAAPGYNAYPASGSTTTSVQQNSTYSLAVTTDQPSIVSVWIDYDQNGTFDATEWQQVTTASTSNVASTLNLTIPSTSTIGQTAMRIRSRFSNNVNGSTDACTSMGSGETEDYVITILPEPPCAGTPTPGNTIASASTACSGSTVNLSVSTPVSGIGISYQWESASDVNFTSNVQSLGTALTQSATVTANTYYRCIVTCSNTSGIGTSVPVLVSLNTDPCACNAYCLPSTPNTCDESITNVTFAGINQNSGCNYPYAFFSATGAVNAGQTYTLNYTVSPYYTSDQVNVFFDWNHDGDFDDAGETYTSDNLGNGSAVIAVPANANTGNTRMRVRLAWGQVPTACGSNAYSEAEDYCVTVSPGTATLNLKCFIEGYYIGGGMMNSVLNNQGLSNPLTDCDSVMVELHDATSPYAMAYSYNGVLKTDGTIMCTFPPGAIGNSYYLVVTHRNAIQTWSANPMTISAVNAYDFSTNSSQAYGSNQASVGGGVWALLSGDINHDLSIDAFDYLIMDPDIANGNSGYLDTDLNGDGSVDAFDYLIYDPNGYNGVTIQAP